MEVPELAAKRKWSRSHLIVKSQAAICVDYSMKWDLCCLF